MTNYTTPIGCAAAIALITAIRMWRTQMPFHFALAATMIDISAVIGAIALLTFECKMLYNHLA